MNKNHFITKIELCEKLKSAKCIVRILGVVAFNFDWDELREIWYEKINSGTLRVEIICESEPQISRQSVIASDRRFSGLSRSYELANFQTTLNAPAMDLRKYLCDRGCDHLEPKSDIKGRPDYKQCFSLRTCYLDIPYPVVNVDDEYFVATPFTKFNDLDSFEQITPQHPQWEEGWKKYFHAYLEDYAKGARKFSTEETKKGNRLEVIEILKNGSRIPMGLMPRDSFLKTAHVKKVIWALIFTRDGKLLIQQRGQNAKDNQGMWDKSVGGHIALEDIASEKAAAREIAEELFTLEHAEQGGHGEIDFININEDKMIFLGEWLPGRRYLLPFSEINNQKDEYYFFRIDYPFSKEVQNSPRHLPNGDIQDVFVYADVFVCIASESFKLDKLNNAKYRLVELYELKDALNDGVIQMPDGSYEVFKPSPDLRNIIRSRLWQELVGFSDFLARMNKKYSSSKNN